MKKNSLLAALILFAGVLFFFNIWGPTLYDAAETTYGEFTKQIMLTGDWVTMHYNGQIIFDKPPLYFWLAAIAAWFFGLNELAIRFWAATAGVLTVVVTFLLGRTFYDKRAGFFAGLISMTSFQFLIQSRIAELDILLTLFITSALYFFYKGYTTGKAKHYWLAYLAMALGLLTKGIIGVAIPGLTIFLFLLFKKELRKLLEIQLLPGLAIILAVGSPWYIAEYLIHGDKFVQFAMGFLFMSRFQGVVSGHPGPWYYYFLALVLGFAPWSQFLPLALWRTWKDRMKDPALLSLCLMIPVFIVFSIAKTKLPNYILPLYPFLAIGVGRLWSDFADTKDRSLLRGMTIANLLLSVVVTLLILGFFMLGTANYAGQYQALLPNLMILGVVLIGGSLISIGAFVIKQYRASFAALPIMVFVLVFILSTTTLPMVEKFKGSKELSAKVNVMIEPDEVIAAYNVGNRPSIVYYNQQTVVFLASEAELLSFIKRKEGYVYTTKPEYEKIKGLVKVFDQRGDLVIIY